MPCKKTFRSAAFTTVILSIFALLPAGRLYADEALLAFDGGPAAPVSVRINRPVPASGLNVAISLPGLKRAAVFSVENPSRIVIDLPGSRVALMKTIPAAANDYVRAVRFGSHPDKLRIVLDMNKGPIPQFSWTQSGNQLLVFIASAGGETQGAAEKAGAPQVEAVETTPEPAPAAVQTAVPTAPPAPTETPLPAPTPVLEPQPPSEPVAAETAEPDAATTPAQQPVETLSPAPPDVTAAPEVSPAAGQTVRSITFEQVPPDSAPVIKVALTRTPQFKLSRKTDRSYLLVIPYAALGGEQLKLPQFPPQDFTGITFFLAAEAGKNVEVTIGVERNMRIAGLTSGNDILIRPARK